MKMAKLFQSRKEKTNSGQATVASPSPAIVWLTTQQAADRLGVYPATVAAWFDQGHLSGYTTPNGHRRIDEASVTAMLSNRGQKVRK
ncbi:MAG: helix-turn-helix domain-containing protein [Anaerolineae bacterium]|nr:helix-turn-helix domain-containing protein [Anaerolineae bacterium]